ncbi:MAG: acetyl-CoA carboxylase biotin carboxylase subunit, partial [Acidimicrobiales bacterium]
MRTLLVANRGEIARRIMRTARGMGLRTVTVYTPEDARSLHAREADAAVAIGDYLDVPALVDAAERSGADAVHPGYGFVSERAPAARAFEAAGITWVGPPADVIEGLGDKVRAKQLMGDAGVPLLPGGPVETAGEIGFPLLVKAAAGGGGRGMRLVRDEGELSAAVEAATREAATAFGDGTVFVERWLDDPRHVEVQVLADFHGNVIHLGERECSIQRRHQKVVEESPSPGIGDGLRMRIADAAVAGARAVGYIGAGTWEFLVDGQDFYFLEVNTRLQVEHPVTELVTGLDLVRLQLEIAAGGQLGERPPIRGHAIEVRLVAEDPAHEWLPSAGLLHRFRAGDVPGVRYDLGFESGSVISPRYDSLLGKVIAHAATRGEAAARLALALDRFEIHGIATNRSLLAALLREEDFLAGRTTTGYLAAHPDLCDDAVASNRRRIDAKDAVEEHAVAVSIWDQDRRRQGQT